MQRIVDSRIALVAILFVCVGSVTAQDSTASKYATQTFKDLPYRSGDDLIRPTDEKGFSTVVWFHGGGLTGGSKSFPDGLLDQGIAVAAVNYHLHPKVKSPAYVEDAAAAVAWVFKNIEQYGGDPKRIYVSGHSASVSRSLMTWRRCSMFVRTLRRCY